MALGDPYVTAAEYRARSTGSSAAKDTDIKAQLVATSRLLDRECNRFFGQDESAQTRVYDGNGEAVLWLPDDIATTQGLAVKVDLDADGDFTDADETLVRDTHFWLGPDNADKGPEADPWEFLEVVPYNNAVLGTWPEARRSVQVTAKFGWPAVPGAIKEATVLITRELRDLEESGFTLTLENIDQGIQMSPKAASILGRIKSRYRRGPRVG